MDLIVMLGIGGFVLGALIVVIQVTAQTEPEVMPFYVPVALGLGCAFVGDLYALTETDSPWVEWLAFVGYLLVAIGLVGVARVRNRAVRRQRKKDRAVRRERSY